MTGAGRGVAWISWIPRCNRAEAIIFSIATYLHLISQARGMTEAGRGVAWRTFCQAMGKIRLMIYTSYFLLAYWKEFLAGYFDYFPHTVRLNPPEDVGFLALIPFP